MRSSYQRYLCKKVLLEISGKHLFQSLVINKVAVMRPATLLKKRLWHSRYPVNFVKFLRTTVLIEHLRTTASEVCNVRPDQSQEKSL